MPKGPSFQSAISKSKKYIRDSLLQKKQQLSFTQYDQTKPVYKLNKYHYFKNYHVIDFPTIKYLAQQFGKPNNVTEVSFVMCKIGDHGLIQFTKGHWQSLMFLNLSDNDLKCEGIRALLKGNFKNLKRLELATNNINGQAFKVLVSHKWLKLQSLDLSFNNIHNRDISFMAPCSWKNLKILKLLNNNIHNNGIVMLVKAHFPQLNEMHLNNNKLTNDASKPLSKCRWKQLKILALDGNYMGDQSIYRLWTLQCYKLQKVSLFSTKTMTFNKNQKYQYVLPTLGGLKLLRKGVFQNISIDICVHKVNQKMTQNKFQFIHNRSIVDMISPNVKIQFVRPTR